MRTDVAKDEELLDLMRAPAASASPSASSRSIRRRWTRFEKSQSVDDIVARLDTLHEHGILTPRHVRDRRRQRHGRSRCATRSTFALEHHITSLMLNIMTPLPGTLQYDEMDAEGRIFDRDWSHYDAQHVVFTPERMTPRQLQRETLRAYRRFYSTRRLLATSPACDFRGRKITAGAGGSRAAGACRKSIARTGGA